MMLTKILKDDYYNSHFDSQRGKEDTMPKQTSRANI